MPAVKASYFFGRSYWGASTFQAPHERWPNSKAYFCSTCGDVWARVVVDATPFEVIPRPCANHSKHFMSESSSVPGSILPYAVGKDWVSVMDWAVAFEHLPPALQQAELGLYYRYFMQESEVQNGNSKE